MSCLRNPLLSRPRFPRGLAPPLRLAYAMALGWSLALSAAPASADVTAAAKAFADGQAAQLANDYALAAEKFELADSIVPSAVALRSAARMRLLAGHEATAATHAANLLVNYPDDSTSGAVAREILDQVSSKLTRVEASCDESCTISTDDKAVGLDKAAKHLFYVAPGPHKVEAWFGNDRKTAREIEAVSNTELHLEFVAPPGPVAPPLSASSAPEVEPKTEPADLAPPAPTEASRSGLHPAWFYTGVGLTVAAGAATTWSGLRTRTLREDFDEHPTQETYDDGRSSQLTTNIFAGTTAALGITTIVLGLVTDWGPDESEGVTVLPTGIYGKF